MYRATKLQITAETDRQVIQTSLLTTDGQKVRKCLCGVGVAAVASVDDRYVGIVRGHQRGTLLAVTHSDNIGKATDNTHRVGYGLTLRH